MKKALTVLFTMLFCSQLISADVIWSSPPVTLSSTMNNASDPQVKMDPNANAVAVWVENGIITAASLPVGGSWSSSTKISNSNASSPRLVVDLNGDATAVWLEDEIVKVATLPYRGSWSSATALSISGSTSPQIAVDSSGNVVVVWANAGLIQSATKLTTGSWPMTPDILSSASLIADSPQIAIGGNGTGEAAVVVWHAPISSVNTIYTASKLIKGAWSLSQAISSASVNSTSPQVVVDFNGNVFATWFRYVSSSTDYYDVVFQSASQFVGNGWSSPVDISTPGVINPANLISRLGVDRNGNVIAAWTTSFDGATLRIQSTILPISTSTWVIPPIDLVVNAYSYDVDLSVNSNGDAFIAYMLSQTLDMPALFIQGSQTNINGFVQQFWSFPQVISQGVQDGFPRLSSVITETTNNVAAVWIDLAGSNIVIQAATATGSIVLPPTDLSLTSKTNDLGIVTEHANILSWQASSDPSVIGYLVFRNGLLIASTGAIGPFSVEDPNRVSGVADTYGVAAYDASNAQSITVTIVSK